MGSVSISSAGTISLPEAITAATKINFTSDPGAIPSVDRMIRATLRDKRANIMAEFAIALVAMVLLIFGGVVPK